MPSKPSKKPTNKTAAKPAKATVVRRREPAAVPTDRALRIGVSARLLHQAPQELGFRNKILQYIEQSLAHWIMEHGAVAFMVPAVAHDSKHAARHLKVEQVVQD